MRIIYNLRILCVILLFSVFSLQSYASHIMGGTATYKYLGSNKYAVSFIMYKDCQNSSTALATSITYYIVPASVTLSFSKIVSSGKYAHTVKLLGSVTNVSSANAACGSSYCTDKGYYNDTFTEGTDTTGYYIYTGNSARNSAISNLALKYTGSAVQSGMTLAAYIPKRGTTNNSPQIVKDMTPSVCEGKTAVFNAGVYDPDGDSLVFSFVDPLEDFTNAGGGTLPNFPTIGFKSGYSITYPFGTSGSPIYMDSTTGIITADIPNKTTVYVVTVLVQDYRVNKLTHKAVKMADTRIDIEFVAVNCGSRPAPKFVKDTLGLKRTVNVGQSFCLNLFTTDTLYSSTYDTMTIAASSATLGDVKTFPKPYAVFKSAISKKRDSATYCWTPTCDHITYSTPHTVTFTISDKSCNTVSETYSIYVKPRAFVAAPKLRCVDILGSKFIKLQWDAIAADTNFLNYNIYREKESSGTKSFTLMSSASAAATFKNYKTNTWTDSTAVDAQDTSYSYYIVSQNKCLAEGFSSDTFQSVHVTSKKNTNGSIEFDWNAISKNYADSFAVYGDTGTGMKLTAVINSRSYIFPYCKGTVKVQVGGRSKATSCLSESNITASYNLTDTTKPVKEPIVNATVVSWAEVDVLFTKTTSSDINHYTIYRGENGGAMLPVDSVYNFGAPLATTILYKDKKATPATKAYCYAVAAVDNCGNRQMFDKFCVYKTHLKIQQRALRLSWNPYVGYTPDTVKVQQYISGKWITRKIVKATDTVFTDTGITCVKRTYRILGFYKTGTLTTLSDSAFGTPTDSVPPSSPAFVNVSYDASNASQINVSFSSVGNKDVAGYKLYNWYNDTLNTVSPTLTTASFPGSLGIAPMVSSVKKYCYDYVAVDSCGNLSKIQKHCAVELLSQKKNLAALLTWTPFNETGLIKYYIERKTTGAFATVDSVKSTDTSVTETGLSCNVSYTYRIRASMPGGVSSYSNTTVVTPFDTVPPIAPVLTNVSVVDGSNIVVNWANSASKKVKIYEIQVKSLNGSWSVFTLATGKNSVTVNSLNTHDSLYDFRVIAIDTCNSNRSAPSVVHQSILLGALGQNLSNTLGFSPYLGFVPKQYDIYSYLSGSWTKVGSVLPAAVTYYTYTDNNLKCNVPYFYKVLAISAASASVTSWSDSVTATPFDTIKPQQVNIRAVSVSSTTATQITFDKVADPVVTKYTVYVSVNGGAYSLLTTITKPSTNPVVYSHTGINTLKDSFAYRIFAIDSCAGNTSATTQTHAPVLLKGTAGDYSASLTWTSYKGFAVKNYIVEAYSGGTWNTLATLASNVKTYTDQPIPCLNKNYRIRVVPASGTQVAVSDSIVLKPFDTVKPSAPVLLYATVSGFNAVSLKWQKSSSNDVRRYDVYRKASAASAFTFLKTVGDVDNYTDKVNADSAIAYCYQVKAVDSCANNSSPFSGTHCVINLKADSNICYQKLYINWSSYVGWASGIKNFLLYRKVQSTGADTLIATLPNTQFSYTDSIIKNTNNYCYKIVAVQNSGALTSSSNYSCSKIYQITVPQIYAASKTATSATNGAVVVKWKSVSNQRFYKYYQLYYKPASSATFTLLKDNIPVGIDSFVHTGINTTSLDHDYYLVIVDSCGNKTVKSVVHQTMTLTISVGQLIHNISWTPYSGFGVKNYIVQRLQGGKFVNVDTVPPTKTKDVIFPAPCNFNIYYRISAIDSFGHFAWSDTVGKRAIDVIPSNAPTLTNATVINDKSVQINFFGADSTDTYAYSIQRQTNGSWATAGTVLFTTKHAAMQFIDNVSTLKDQHCYTIITLDSCLNATPSDTFCTITLTGKPLNEANRLNWTKFKGYKMKNYTVLRLIGNSWVPLSVLTSKDTTLLHDSLHCYLPQYYKIMGTESGGNRVTYSDSIQLIPFDTITPPPSKLQYASVMPNGKVKLLWAYNKYSDVKYFEVWRKVNSNPFAYVNTVVLDSTYIDNGVNVHTDTLSYYIITVDSCNATHRSMPSDTDRMMNVKITTNACTPLNHIDWTGYKSLQGGTDSFTIWRSTLFSPPVKLVSVGSKVLQYDDYAVVVGTQYTYIIQARGPKNNLSSFTDTFNVIPHLLPLADTARQIYTSVVQTGIGNGIIHIQWQPAPGKDTLARGYHLYEADPATNVYKLIYSTSNLADTSYTQTGINTYNALHEYKLAVYNLCKNDGPAGNIHQPVNLKVKANNNLTAQLSWTSYLGAGVKSYDIYKSDNKGSMHLIANTTPITTGYLDTGLVCLHHYVYQLRAKLANGITSLSDTFGVTGSDTALPPQARLYIVSTDTTLKTGGKIGLRWSGNSKVSRKGFNIYRQVNNGPFAFYYQLSTAKTDTIFWEDNAANTVDNTYAYYINSIDSCGNEAMPLDTHRVVNARATAYSRYIQVNWTPYHGFANFKYVLEKRKLNSSWQPIISFTSAGLSYSDSNVNCHVYYLYRIRYIDAKTNLYGFSNISGDTAYDTVPPKVSQLLRATVLTTSKTKGVVELDWNASVTSNVYGYLVSRSNDNVNWKQNANMVIGLSYNDSNLNTYDRSYYYKITPIDTCGNVGIGFSSYHRTINLRTQPGNQVVTLHWNKYGGWKLKNYNIYRNGQLLATASKDSVRFADTIASCIHMYHYWIEAVADSNIAITSISNEDSARPYDNIKPNRVYVRSASIDVPAGQVVLTWDSSKSFDVKNYYIYRKTARTGEMVFVDSTDKTIYYEDISHIKGPDCYYVFARDYCRNQSDGSNRACLIILQGRNEKDHNLLNWNSYSDWPDGIKEYNVYKNEDNKGWIQIGATNKNVITYDDNTLSSDVVDYCYQVEAVEKDGGHEATSKSTVVCLHHDPAVYIADAFTPLTTLGLNDSFGPKGMFIKNYHMDVYNRWGEVVYHTDNGGKWDGKFQGTVVPANVYMYAIKVEGYNGDTFFYKGNVMILY